MFQVVLTSLSLMIALTLTPIHALAQAPDARYVPARALALGSAGIPLVDDGAGALFYQPAMLAKRRRVSFEPINLQVYGSKGFFGTANRASMNATSIDAIAGNLRSNSNTPVGMGASLLPSFSMPFLSFGVLAQTKFSAYADEQGKIYSRSLYQLVPAIGTGINLGHGILKLGYSLQYVNQSSGKREIAATNTDPGGFNEAIGEGHAFSHNVGFALTLPYQHLPSLHLVARNIGGLTYSSGSMFPVAKNPTGVPDFEPMTFDVAIGWMEKIGKGSSFNWTLQGRDFTNGGQTSAGIRYSTGLELAIKESIYFRGGFGNGYPSAGIGFRAKKHSDFSLSWYSEELTSHFHGMRDQRYVLQYQMTLF